MVLVYSRRFAVLTTASSGPARSMGTMTMPQGAPGLSRSRCLFGLVLMISGMLAGCGASSSSTSSPAPAIPKLTITAGTSGYTLDPTTPLPAGTIELDLKNDSNRPTQFMFGTPLGTTTLAQVRTTVTSGDPSPLQRQVEFGLGWSLPPAESQTLFITYQASTNFVLSLISMGPGSPLQAAQGYLAQFKVQGSTPKSEPQPAVAGTMTVTAHSLTVPPGFGKGTFAMLNTDASSGHQLTFFHFTGAAKPLSEVVAAMGAAGQLTGPTPPPGPPPDVALGLQAMGSAEPLPAFGCSCIMGSRVLGTFAWSPGTYVALGTGYDPTTHVFDGAAGIAAEFTVS